MRRTVKQILPLVLVILWSVTQGGGDAGLRLQAFGDPDSLGHMVELREWNMGMRSKYDCEEPLRGLIQRLIVDSTANSAMCLCLRGGSSFGGMSWVSFVLAELVLKYALSLRCNRKLQIHAAIGMT